MPIVKPALQRMSVQSVVSDFIMKDFGHFVVASDDRIFSNTLRRTLVSELGLPSNCMTVVTNADHVLRTVKEMSVKKKSLLVFIQPAFGPKRIDDVIKYIAWKVKNARIILLTTESELKYLALLREEGIADNWIVKPVVINQLIPKTASVIKPQGAMERLIKAAEDFLEDKAYNNVLSICRKIFEGNAQSAVACMLMGDAYRGLEQEDEMVAAYEQSNYIDNLNLDPIKKLIDYFKERGDFEKVVSYLEKMDVISPLNLERKIEIASLHLELGHGRDAYESFESAMKFSNKKALADVSSMATQIGDILSSKNDPLASSYYRKALDIFGENVDSADMHLFNNLAIELRKQGKPQEALGVYQQALSINPVSDAIHYNMALAYDGLGEMDSCIRSINKALDLNPGLYEKNYVAAYNIGRIFLKAGDVPKGVECLEKSLEINPEYDYAKVLLQAVQKRRAKPNAGA